MRKTEFVKVPSWEGDNRDAGRTFKLTEMSAAQAEKWAWRMVLAMKGTGASLPREALALGMVGIAFAGVDAFLGADVDKEAMDALLDEMMTCVQIVRDPKYPEVATDLASPDDVEEVRTRLWLRSEVLRLHTSFSLADALSTWMAATRPSTG